MTLAEHTHPNEYEQALEAKTVEIAQLKRRIVELEIELASAKEAPKLKRDPRKISAYKVHDFVTVIVPGHVDDQDGKIIEFLPGKAAVTVATSKGTFSIGDPTRIKRQSEEW